MSVMKAERQLTGKLAIKFLTDPENNKRLRQSGFKPSTPVVACEWETTVSEVRGMLRRQDGVKSLFVLIRKDEEMLLLAAASVPNLEDVPEDAISLHGLEPELQIGMVYDSLNARPFLRSLPEASLGSRIGQYSLVPA